MSKNFIIALGLVLVLGIGVGVFWFFNSDGRLVGNLIQNVSTSSRSSPGKNENQLQNQNRPSGNNNAEDESLQNDSPDIDNFNAESLAQFNGISGNSCYVAVDGVVYDITGADGWSNGVHTASGGRAKCGQDGSAVIGQSPHGKSAVTQYPVVGNYR